MRLIDADALRAEFKEDERGLYHYTGIWAAIDAAPTIDAVPVVRCKDCKHWYHETVGMIEHYECSVFCDCYGRGYLTGADDFCSCGEIVKEITEGKNDV